MSSTTKIHFGLASFLIAFLALPNLSLSAADLPQTTTEVYDISDLLMGGKDEKRNAEVAGQITKLIQDVIDIESWADKGGKSGTLKYFRGQLIVTQTKENQKQILQLLEKLRETRTIQ